MRRRAGIREMLIMIEKVSVKLLIILLNLANSANTKYLYLKDRAVIVL